MLISEKSCGASRDYYHYVHHTELPSSTAPLYALITAPNPAQSTQTPRIQDLDKVPRFCHLFSIVVEITLAARSCSGALKWNQVFRDSWFDLRVCLEWSLWHNISSKTYNVPLTSPALQFIPGKRPRNSIVCVWTVADGTLLSWSAETSQLERAIEFHHESLIRWHVTTPRDAHYVHIWLQRGR